MIPKRIHYCWFGEKRKDDLVMKCVQSWRTFMPDYDVIEWNEENSPMDIPFVDAAYKRGMWNVVSDYVRLYAVYTRGGVYLDADVEVIRRLDPLLHHPCFLGFQLLEEHDQWETGHWVNSAVLGAEAENEFLTKCMETTADTFEREGRFVLSPLVVTTMLREMGLKSYGLQRMGGVTLFPRPYFYPYAWFEEFSPKCITESTFCVHHWTLTWIRKPSLGVEKDMLALERRESEARRWKKAALSVTGFVTTLNGAERLAKTLPLWRNLVDELIVFVDETTVDGTEIVARGFTDRIVKIRHPALAELHLERIVSECRGEWILHLDDDETVIGFTRERLLAIASKKGVTHAWIPRKWLVGKGDYYIATGPWFPAYQLRYYRNLPSIMAFPTRVHESVQLAGHGIFLADECILHMDFVWNSLAAREKKVQERYKRLRPDKALTDQYLFEKHPHEIRPLFLRHERLPEGSKKKTWKPFLTILDWPMRIRWGLSYAARVRIFNRTGETLVPDKTFLEAGNAMISYHWLDAEEPREKIVQWDNPRFPLPMPLEPGEEADALIPVLPPPGKGRFLLQFDLVDEHYRKIWFSQVLPDSGWPKVRVEVE